MKAADLTYAKKELKEAFEKEYGFSPALKDIDLLETSETKSGKYTIFTFIACAVGGKGYTWSLTDGRIEKNKSYDLRS